MTSKLIQIGNSKGVRLPKAVIEQAGLENEVTIRVEGQRVIIEPKKKNLREGWDKIMAAAVRKHGNELTQEDIDWLNMPSGSDFDEKEWTW